MKIETIEIKLLNCAECGQEPDMDKFLNFHIVYCNYCGIFAGDFNEPIEAIKTWNRLNIEINQDGKP